MSENTAVKKVMEDQEHGEIFRKAQNGAANGLSHVAERIHDRSDSAKEFLDEKVTNAEELVGEKTKKIAESSRQKLDTANSLGHRTADFIDSSSESIRNMNLSETREKVITSIRERPEIAIVTAAAFGLGIGYMVGKRQ